MAPGGLQKTFHRATLTPPRGAAEAIPEDTAVIASPLRRLTRCRATSCRAEIAQLVEHQLPKLRVAGSSPVFRSRISRFLAFAGEEPFFSYPWWRWEDWFLHPLPFRRTPMRQATKAANAVLTRSPPKKMRNP